MGVNFMSSSIPDSITQDGVCIPVVEEQLAIGTRVVDTGRGVRIHKTVSEQPVIIDERLVRDEIDVRHVLIERIVALEEAPTTRYEGDTLVVPVFEEVLVVERRLRIKEELHITRIRHEEHYQDTVSLKAERVEIERFDDAGSRQHHDT
jgi:stress response protein YsnF